MPADLFHSTQLFGGLQAASVAPRPRLLSVGVFETSGDYVFRRHQHLAYEAIIPIRGRYRARLGGDEVALAPWQVLLVKPGDWHEDLLDPGVRYWGISFALGEASVRTVGGWFAGGVAAREQVASPPPRELRPLLERLRRESEHLDAFAPLVQDALLAEFAWRLARAFPPSALAPALSGATQEAGFATRLERAFAARLRGRFPVPDMAKAMGMSRTVLAETCQRQLGLPPARAFVRYRLDRAYALLSRTGMSVVEVADHLGFENPFHFSRAFKRRWGMPPSRVIKG